VELEVEGVMRLEEDSFGVGDSSGEGEIVSGELVGPIPLFEL